MTMRGLCLFDTAFGRCGIAWGPGGVLAVSFPDSDGEKTRARLLKRVPGAEECAPPPEIADIIEAVAALFEGEKRDLSFARLDWRGVGEFERKVYELTSAIAPGQTKTYGEIARAIGDVAFSQRVGQALGKNPFPIIVPCHRVVGADGKMTGFSAPGGMDAKRSLLKIEGALPPELFD